MASQEVAERSVISGEATGHHQRVRMIVAERLALPVDIGLIKIAPTEPSCRLALNKASKVKRSTRRQLQRARADDINEVVQLGFRIGSALNEARHREREQLRWVAPYWVNQDLLGDEAM